MKYTINQITQGEDELILNYKELNEEVEQVLAFMGRENRRILGWKEDEQVVIAPNELLYMESVEGKTFAYTAKEVYRLNYTL
ncbi:MAG: LytTR family transcriptional regulator, partial [Lachnospiraceae bacterium]|nr:LytTR family transcriptional regulator [Lachnospiraceae bacterium]